MSGREETPRYVTVRLAVAVDSQGEWQALGWETEDEKALADRAAEELHMATDEPERPHGIVWVEAEVPVPTEERVLAMMRDMEIRVPEAWAERQTKETGE